MERLKCLVGHPSASEVQMARLTEADFQRALAVVLAHEGGYVNNPHDPGGATNFGITQKTYDAWRQKVLGKGRTRDVRLIGKAEVETIYRTEYWEASRAPTLPYPLALVQFDTAVNMGVGRALEFLAASGGNVTTYLDLRRKRYAAIVEQRPDSAEFLPGWLKRVDSLATAAVAKSSGLAVLAAVLLGALYYLWRRSTAS